MFRPLPTSDPNAQAHPSPYPLGQFSGPHRQDHLMALLTFSHTPVEDQLYRTILREATQSAEGSSGTFSIRTLAKLTGISSFSTIRRALAGLLGKLSIEITGSASEQKRRGASYRIFKPEEIFERRRAAGLVLYPKEIEASQRSPGFNRAIERVVGNSNLSRREAQVALSCVEGITNAEIGQRLFVSEQTVKFHLRNVFIKFGVRRRAELISRLLLQDDRPRVSTKGARKI